LKQYLDLGEDSDLDYKVFRFFNKDDKEWEFSKCRLLDSSVGYLLVIKTSINTSSVYSLWRCGMDREESGDESEEKEKSWTPDEICDLLHSRPWVRETWHIRDRVYISAQKKVKCNIWKQSK
jgi:hypothetical protein